MLKNSRVKIVLSALAITIFGFILLNLAFLLDFAVQSATLALVRLFTPVDFSSGFVWLPPLLHCLFLVIITVITWFIYRSKIKSFYKATYLTVPTAVFLVTLGMFLYSLPFAAVFLGGLSVIAVLYIFYRTKQPWIYYFSVILVSLVLLIGFMTGMEI